ncbi:MAG: hypothetical protein QM758_19990 [Armatimonas sp.]
MMRGLYPYRQDSPGGRRNGSTMAQFMLQCRISTKDIDEASGMAASVKNPGVLWINNDSGDGPFLYAVDAKTGQLRAYLKFAGVEAEDWEALRLGPDGVFSVGDIGDNDQERTNIRLYRAPEPVIPPGGPHRLTARGVQTFPLRYPDGPHNAEALLLDPKTKAHYIVTKTDSGISQVFALLGLRELKQLGTINAGGKVTDGAISPDGHEVAILTYKHLLLWRLPAGKPLIAALQTRPTVLPVPKELKKAEAIAYSSNGRMLYMTSEGKKPEIYGLNR